MRSIPFCLGAFGLANAACPGGFGDQAPLPDWHTGATRRLSQRPPAAHSDYGGALAALNFAAVKQDLATLMKDSKEFWPADSGHYGPFFIRQAWHCAGTYRLSDGRGGCGGGLQRFEPERSWADNTNLDKAKLLLWPIKAKYGVGLSWGDLIILAANVAIEDMGGPVLGFCAGRMDDDSGEASEALGPSELQRELFPCTDNTTCEEPFGSTTMGLIYLNPEGPLGQPVPSETYQTIRSSFGRMNMNDTETVALIGGGHAFGKTHGACPDGPGPAPNEDPRNPWPGACGTGKGSDTFTSGFEGSWTTKPTTWDVEYFQSLVNYSWKKHIGPGGHWQWMAEDAPELMMLTSDVSLMHDDSYRQIVTNWAENQASFDHAFAHAWYKLTSRDMGPVTRCFGNDVPEALDWQYPLPKPPARAKLVQLDRRVKQDVRALIGSMLDESDAAKGPVFIKLAFQCASTFRTTDFLGGCNGARMRFDPQRGWPSNAGMDQVLEALRGIKDKYGDRLTWADLIVLAGTTAAEKALGQPIPFCGGRSDALDGAGSEHLSPRIDADSRSPLLMKDALTVMGLSISEMVVMGRLLGIWHESGATLDGHYFQELVAGGWTDESSSEQYPKKLYRSKHSNLTVSSAELVFVEDPEFLVHSQRYAFDEDAFAEDFVAAWTKLMNADMFDGPTGNVCTAPQPRPPPPRPPRVGVGLMVAAAAGSAAAAVFLLAACAWRRKTAAKEPLPSLAVSLQPTA